MKSFNKLINRTSYTLIIAFLLFCGITACSTDDTQDIEQEEAIDLSNLELGDISKNLDLDYDYVFDLSKTSINVAVDSITTGFYAQTPPAGKRLELQIGSDGSFLVGNITEHPTSTYADEDCGEGENWESFGTCHSKSCVEDKSADAAVELVDELGSGECMDIRIKRNTFSVEVCGRVISC